ncbi:MAG: carbohydrate ABC transporter permease [Porcincola intestinalis]|uniref:Carbohydrate ABC transporter permease n=1 Tax=Porcincola intestinalis TaxID=2606632 RepID=A0A6L5X6B1_9FIRM|nr:carbohydrate ABC transporter permease [Porcincola intestinalis]MCI7092365.1 carbohydrate ABC transporter permease [Lachnospiraceae bacterium]MDY4205799.1 carbohydrate ABC transporter permease [Porcincola intestinalis]MDY5331690.1 carbohydrate ABC transporter permease [Porcincola intestinalis]MSS15889.1 carbohydrate ABC transporter permease [Porcincola intestinalis]
MNKKKKIKAPTIVIYVFLSLMLVLYLAPLVWIGLTSFKSRPEIYKAPFGWPKAFHFENYAMAWKAGRLGIAMMNSLFVCVITLILTMVIGSMAAFAIARMRWKLAGAAMVYILIGMMIPVHCVLIPLFVRFAKIGLSNNLWGLILPYLTFSLPTCVFIMAGFFRSIPNELLESACMDGCSIFQMFFKICFPLARTGLFVTGLMTFIGNWNELLLALVFVSDDTKKTLPVALTKFVTPYQTNYDKMFPAIMIAIIPTIVVYCMFSNQIVDGLTTGAVKG